jgi:hypothetical protein
MGITQVGVDIAKFFSEARGGQAGQVSVAG